jgi:DNA replication protein DnaC
VRSKMRTPNLNPVTKKTPTILDLPLEADAVHALLGDLKLRYFDEALTQDLIEMLPAERGPLLAGLYKWSMVEIAERRAAQIAARIKSSRFKRIQTVDAFDFDHSKATQDIKKAYLALHSNIGPGNLPSAVFTGNAGLGKTHLARALGYAACQKGLTTLFITAAEMVNRLSAAQKSLTIENELNKYRRPQVLVIDELGYVTLDNQASNLFFQVISARHDQSLGTIATTNIPFGKFNQIFANDAIAHAIVDRLVNEAEVFFLEGPSYREHQRKEKSKNRMK